MIQPSVSGKSRSVAVKDTGILLTPDSRRVIVRPHVPFSEVRAGRIIARALSLDEAEVQRELKDLVAGFAHRHHNFESLLERQFEAVRRQMPSDTNY